MLLKKWRAELSLRLATAESHAKLRGEKAAAEARAMRAEAEAGKVRAMMAAAAAAHVEQIESAGAALGAAKGAAEALELRLAQSEAGRASAEQNNALIAEAIPSLTIRFETTAGALAKTEAQVSAVLARSATLEVRAQRGRAVRAAHASSQRPSTLLPTTTTHNVDSGCSRSRRRRRRRCAARPSSPRSGRRRRS